MRITHIIAARRSTLLFIAVFSCVQVALGFFLITEKSPDNVASLPSALHQHNLLAYKPMNNDGGLSNILKETTIASITPQNIHASKK